MLTPKEKANQLFVACLNRCGFIREYAKDCALLVIDQLIMLSGDEHEGEPDQYLIDVKTEIEAIQ